MPRESGRRGKVKGEIMAAVLGAMAGFEHDHEIKVGHLKTSLAKRIAGELLDLFDRFDRDPNYGRGYVGSVGGHSFSKNSQRYKDRKIAKVVRAIRKSGG
ncbi:hypothetical protein LCGC14_0312720 [marine sediment metagenome]|uniref:Uncharacterized protein n=1 Tax=marine sediment metagenome TaxID=412755 RepID=A0A0F9TLI0_9ZZZZ